MVTVVEKRGRGRPKKVVQQAISVALAAESGDTLAALKALRDKLAREIDECGSKRDLASLSWRKLKRGTRRGHQSETNSPLNGPNGGPLSPPGESVEAGYPDE